MFLTALGLANIPDMFLPWWKWGMQQSKLPAQEQFKLPFMPYLLMSHQPNQVKWTNLKSRSRANTQPPIHEATARVWEYNTRGEGRTEISYSNSHSGVSCHPLVTHHLPLPPLFHFTFLQGSRIISSLHLCRMVSLSFIPEAWFPSPDSVHLLSTSESLPPISRKLDKKLNLPKMYMEHRQSPSFCGYNASEPSTMKLSKKNKLSPSTLQTLSLVSSQVREMNMEFPGSQAIQNRVKFSWGIVLVCFWMNLCPKNKQQKLFFIGVSGAMLSWSNNEQNIHLPVLKHIPRQAGKIKQKIKPVLQLLSQPGPPSSSVQNVAHPTRRAGVCWRLGVGVGGSVAPDPAGTALMLTHLTSR